LENVHLLADNFPERLGVYSFYIDNLHYNLVVQLLNDKYGIQVRGGCSCAGTYGHILLNVQTDQSCDITTKINKGDLTSKPGWVRMSIHPTMTDDEMHYIMNAIEDIAKNYKELGDEKSKAFLDTGVNLIEINIDSKKHHLNNKEIEKNIKDILA
jgi:selenocysteine lyase/cysteine desulfurase